MNFLYCSTPVNVIKTETCRICFCVNTRIQDIGQVNSTIKNDGCLRVLARAQRYWQNAFLRSRLCLTIIYYRLVCFICRCDLFSTQLAHLPWSSRTRLDPQKTFKETFWDRENESHGVLFAV